VSDVSVLVHESSSALTTMGAARLHNLWAWDDPSLGLDFLQVHTYPDLHHPKRDADVFGMAADTLGVRGPVVLGEFAANAPQQHPRGAHPPAMTLEHYLEFAVHGGYAGGWPWSFSGTDAYGRIPAEPLHQFAVRYPELVNPRATALTMR
jgi:hypothetical protein